MSIKETLQEDIKTAMKARDQKLLTVLRGLSAAVKQVEIDTRKEIGDAEVLAIFHKEVKKRRDSIGFAKQGGREDLVAGDEFEIGVLEKYVGEQLSEEKLAALIEKIISDGADSIGAVMGALNKEHKGQFDGKVASQLIKGKLQ